MASRRRKIAGPRVADRWIGDAFVLEGDLLVGAPAVWRGGDARCAVVRVVEVMFDDDFVDRGHVRAAQAIALAGPGIVPRLATYQQEDMVALVDDDVADVSLRELIAALHGDEGRPVPLGLALAVTREIVRALTTAGHVQLDLRPQRISVAWDGRVLLRAVLPSAYYDDENADVDRVLYGINEDEPVAQLPVAALLLHEILRGEHPFGEALAVAEDDDDLDLAGEGPAMMRDLMASLEPLEGMADDVSALLTAMARGTLAAADALLAFHDLDDVFAPVDVGAMIAGLLPKRKRDGALEREDRLQVMPGPRVEPEVWPVFDPDAQSDDGGFLEDLDDVRSGLGEYTDEPYEPSVPPVDPFDDDE